MLEASWLHTLTSEAGLTSLLRGEMHVGRNSCSVQVRLWGRMALNRHTLVCRGHPWPPPMFRLLLHCWLPKPDSRGWSSVMQAYVPYLSQEILLTIREVGVTS